MNKNSRIVLILVGAFAFIDAWLAQQGRLASSFNPVERLCYIGTRGMGALEFHPAIRSGGGRAKQVHINALVELANTVLNIEDTPNLIGAAETR